MRGGGRIVWAKSSCTLNEFGADVVKVAKLITVECHVFHVFDRPIEIVIFEPPKTE